MCMSSTQLPLQFGPSRSRVLGCLRLSPFSRQLPRTPWPAPALPHFRDTLVPCRMRGQGGRDVPYRGGVPCIIQPGTSSASITDTESHQTITFLAAPWHTHVPHFRDRQIALQVHVKYSAAFAIRSIQKQSARLFTFVPIFTTPASKALACPSPSPFSRHPCAM